MKRIKRAIRLARALATDKRVPAPLRLMLKIALAIKCVPVPDFGIDEVLLATVGGVLLVFYRPLLREIAADAHAG